MIVRKYKENQNGAMLVFWDTVQKQSKCVRVSKMSWRENDSIKTIVCVTGQHKEMLSFSRL